MFSLFSFFLEMNCSDASKKGAMEEDKVTIVPIGKLSYHNVIIGLFTDSSDRNPRRFFFEPVVLLDTKSISCQTHQLFKQEVVRFSVKMWNSELRSKVRDRIQSLPTFKHLEIQDDDIFVLPYEEVQLVLKPGSSMDQSIQLMDQPMTSFHRRSNESLDFYFICDTQLTATILADNLREYPDFVLQKWKLALECRGLVLGNEASSKSPVVTINVSTQPTDEVPPSISHRKKISRPTTSLEFHINICLFFIGPDARLISIVEGNNISDLIKAKSFKINWKYLFSSTPFAEAYKHQSQGMRVIYKFNLITNRNIIVNI